MGHKVIFLRKLVPGGSNHSFGIYVAKMAGMPRSVVERAAHILSELEQKSIGNEMDGGSKKEIADTLRQMPTERMQLSIFETVDPIAGKLKESLVDLDLNAMTPIDCMLKLNELKKLIEE